MKSVNFLVLVCVFSLLSNFAIAGGGIDPATKFAYNVHTVKGTEKIRLAFENTSESDVTIKIFDQNNKLVFSEVQKHKKSMSKNYDLSQLGKGTYRIELISGGYKAEEKLVVGAQEEQNYPFSLVVAPYKTQNSFVVSYSNAANSVYVNVYNEKGEEVYQNALSGYHFYNQVYTLNDLPKGKYEVIVSGNGGEQKQIIDVK